MPVKWALWAPWFALSAISPRLRGFGRRSDPLEIRINGSISFVGPPTLSETEIDPIPGHHFEGVFDTYAGPQALELARDQDLEKPHQPIRDVYFLVSGIASTVGGDHGGKIARSRLA